MCLFTRLALTTLLLAALALPALAAGTPVDLPNGETVTLMHPGVDGVEAPWAVRSRMVAPRYPDQSDPLPTGTMVQVAVMVLADGSVAQLEVLGARHPNLGYEEAAKNAVSRWKFKPARLDGETVNSYVIYDIEFPTLATLWPDSDPLGIAEGRNPNDMFFLQTGPGGGTYGTTGSAGGNATMGFSNGARVTVASTPRYSTGQLTDRNNSGQYVGTTDWADKNGR